MKTNLLFFALLVSTAGFFAECRHCQVDRVKVHKLSNSTQYVGHEKDGTLIHITRTEPTEATLSGKKVKNVIVKGQLHPQEEMLDAQQTQEYYDDMQTKIK